MAELVEAGVVKPGCDESFYGSDEETRAFAKYLESRPMGTGSHSLLARGLYELQLRPWLAAFDRDTFLLLKLEEMKKEGGLGAVMARVFGHLGLPNYEVVDEGAKNSRDYEPMGAAMKERLKLFYEPYDRRLFDLMKWDKW
jgi:hypothetical protein